LIQDWTILNRNRIADFKIFQIEKKQVRSPRTGEIREIQAIRSPGWVLVLGLTPQAEVVMVRQYRHGTEQICLELPGGLVDANDASAALSAQRELLEETGYKAKELELMGECFPQPAILSNKCFFYLARNVEKIHGQNLDAGEDIEVLTVPLKSISSKIETKEINHGMVLLAFFFFWMKHSKFAQTQ
jgi:8-oxo-dGTP pyrophosphatase MutT (NUDIX family)